MMFAQESSHNALQRLGRILCVNSISKQLCNGIADFPQQRIRLVLCLRSRFQMDEQVAGGGEYSSHRVRVFGVNRSDQRVEVRLANAGDAEASNPDDLGWH